ncbi:phospholipase A2 inhibitor gamma subunit B-like [Spea bombifrons]|uniref:phospholipase A2 inhibitor gamma subunit B-like n=1 Tax=Spea bombifrons TaxID=233779 RepID=UPI0023496D01|nr:phospholipase A2 inhibitor gamma subunit B-like [Spea bombifrons]
MNFLLLFTIIFLDLTARGHALSCIQCVNQDEAKCSGPSIVCHPSQNACASSYTVIMIGGMEINKQFLRHCESRAACDKHGSISVPDGRIKKITNCCFSDNCTPPSPVFPPDKKNKNGVRCPSCYAPNNRTCTSEYIMECLGDENRCITKVDTFSGAIRSTVAMRGCASKEVCEISHYESEFGNIKSTADIFCTGRGVALRNNLYLLGLSAMLLLLKLIT